VDKGTSQATLATYRQACEAQKWDTDLVAYKRRSRTPLVTSTNLQAQTGSWSWKRREKGKETEKEKEMLIERTTMLMSEREMKLAIPKTWMDSGASSTQHQT
jgi:hypothetical protein